MDHSTFRFGMGTPHPYTQTVGFYARAAKRRWRALTQGRCACVGLLALSTVVPAFSQTSALERIAPELSSSRPKQGPADVSGSVPGPCSAVPKQLFPCATAREQAQLA